MLYPCVPQVMKNMQAAPPAQAAPNSYGGLMQQPTYGGVPQVPQGGYGTHPDSYGF